MNTSVKIGYLMQKIQVDALSKVHRRDLEVITPGEPQVAMYDVSEYRVRRI